MISINLLPPERRPIERTPFPRLVTILLGVTLFTVEVLAGAFIWISIPSLKEKMVSLDNTVKLMKEEAKEVDDLTARIQLVDKRLEIVEGIRVSHVKWTPVLDHLWGLVPDKLWLVTLDVEGGTDKPGKGKLEGYVRGNEGPSTVGQFIADLQKDTYVKDAIPKIDLKSISTETIKQSKSAKGGGEDFPTSVVKFQVDLETKAKPAPPKQEAPKKPVKKK